MPTYQIIVCARIILYNFAKIYERSYTFLQIDFSGVFERLKINFISVMTILLQSLVLCDRFVSQLIFVIRRLIEMKNRESSNLVEL